MESTPKTRTEVKSIKSGKNPEGKQMFREIKVKVPVLAKGETPPPPEGPNPINSETGEEASIQQFKLPVPEDH
jgi:hypothetical protein